MRVSFCHGYVLSLISISCFFQGILRCDLKFFMCVLTFYLCIANLNNIELLSILFNADYFQMNVKKAMDKLSEWANAGEKLRSYLPENDEVLVSWLSQLEEFSQDLPFLLQLSSDALKVQSTSLLLRHIAVAHCMGTVCSKSVYQLSQVSRNSQCQLNSQCCQLGIPSQLSLVHRTMMFSNVIVDIASLVTQLCSVSLMISIEFLKNSRSQVIVRETLTNQSKNHPQIKKLFANCK